MRQPLRHAHTGLALLALLLLSACGVTEADVAAHREATLATATVTIRAELQNMLERGDAALDAVARQLPEANGEAARFEQLEAIRVAHAIDGIFVEDTRAGARTWAGRSIDRIRLPAHAPWEQSFENGSLRYHEGPFVRALLIQRTYGDGISAYVTYVLDEHRPGDPTARPFGDRWLDPLGLKDVRLHHPALDVAPAEDQAGRRTVRIEDAEDRARLVVELRVRGPEAEQERLAQRSARDFGWVLLVLWLLAVLLVRRFVIWRSARLSVRWLVFAGWALVARQALFWIDLPARFVGTAPLFAPDRFSVDTPLGWFGSPADFLLSAATLLIATICVTRAAARTRAFGPPGLRLVFIGLAPFLAAVFAGGWLLLVEQTVFGGQATFFAAQGVLPPPEDALLLAGLVLITAVAYLLTAAVLHRAWRLWPERTPPGARLTLGVAAVGLTALLASFVGSGGWIAIGLPLVSILLAGQPEREPAIGMPSRALLMSVLATFLLLPVLWVQVQRRAAETLPDRLDAVLLREAEVRPHLERTLIDLSENEFVRGALRRAQDGPRPEGLAIAIWFSTEYAARGDPGIVTVLDARGRTRDEFALASVPPKVLPTPTPQPPSQPDIDVAVNEASDVRAVVGRLRVRGVDGQVLGYVVLTVPDLLDLKLGRLEGSLSARGDASLNPLHSLRSLQVASLRDGLVEAADDPTVPKTLGGFGPAALADLGPDNMELGWETDAYLGYARWVPERSRAIAVRRELPGFEDALLAVSRVVAVGVGLGALVALLLLLVQLRSFRPRLHHKLLLAFFGISIVPLTLLGLATAREAKQRYDSQLTDRLQTDLKRVRGDMRALGASIFHQARDQKLVTWSAIAHHDVLLYGRGQLEATSRRGLVSAELLSSRLPAEVYRATVLERRQVIRKATRYDGREVWLGYTPVPDDTGRTRATVAVPLRYDEDRVEAAVTVTGSALLAGYLLAVVLVLVIGIYAARKLTRPLADLATATQQVAQGELDIELPGEGEDELGSLVAAFNGMTRELREMTDRAAQAEREMAWRRMARQIAHEIRNPLTPMRLMIQQMQAAVERDPASAGEAIESTVRVLLKQIDALRKIAGDFANFARQPKRNLKDVDVTAVVEHVTALHSGQARQGVQVKSRVGENLPTVWGDEDELTRVLLNLVSNAVQSIEASGRVVVEATPETRADIPGVRIEVADNGVGIPDGNRARLFDPHFSTKTSGTGLGLAIVARIIQDMGGSIDVESQTGHGTTFSLWFRGRPE